MKNVSLIYLAKLQKFQKPKDQNNSRDPVRLENLRINQHLCLKQNKGKPKEEEKTPKTWHAIII